MPAEQREDLFGILVGDEAKIDLGGGASRQDGLGTGTLVARSETADGAGGLEDLGDLQLDAAGETFEEFFDAVALFVFVGDFRQGFHQLDVARGGRFDAVIEARDADALIGAFEGC